MLFKMDRFPTTTCLLFISLNLAFHSYAYVTFEKSTNMDWHGNIYYTINNLSLFECHGWCHQEPECKAVTFSFVLNPLTPIQQTKCEMQNVTDATKIGATSRKAVNVYYFSKIHLRSEKVCKKRLWAFERIPNKVLPNRDNAIFFTATKEDCLASCLSEGRFVCRSVEYNYKSRQCQLSNSDRRTASTKKIELQHDSDTDYFENACLKGDEQCAGGPIRKLFHNPIFGSISPQAIAHHVDLNYYSDKALQVTSSDNCKRSCILVQDEFACRSYLYKPNVRKTEPNCLLYHVDHHILPDGENTFTTPAPPPLLDDGGSIAQYYEVTCIEDSYERPTTPTIPAQKRTDPVTYPQTNRPIKPILTKKPDDPACDSLGVCYDVTVQCENTGITISVNTNSPFNGRIYALGRSETCNKNIRNSQKFDMRMSLTGQDCNTQALGGIYSNTIVVQHHNVVMTKTDKVYNVRCTYDVKSKNISFGMMPVRDPDSMYITSAPEAPMPRIIILGADGREASTVRIGDQLTFRIEIPDQTPYGIFARSCYAMAKDSRNSFQIVDDRGCPVDPGIFPRFLAAGNGLQSTYEAFRFTESYGVIFQCNVKYCIGTCEPAVCNLGRENVEAWGRRKRSIGSAAKHDKDMTLSQEILVLDFGDDRPNSLQNRNFNTTRGDTFNIHETVRTYEGKCPTKTSVLALSVTCALLLVSYITTLLYMYSKKSTKKQFH